MMRGIVAMPETAEVMTPVHEELCNSHSKMTVRMRCTRSQRSDLARPVWFEFLSRIERRMEPVVCSGFRDAALWALRRGSRKLLKGLARRTGRFPQLVDSRSGMNR